jgi:N utilization substance protein B
VLQTLFEWDFLPADQKPESPDLEIKEILKRNLQEFAPGFEEDPFASALLEQTLKKRVTIDEIIEKAAPDWPIDKISVIDRNILRIGLTELLFGDSSEVPPKVAINEAIELAKTFGGENSGKFVNGVLGAVYKEIGEPGKEQQSRKKKEEPIDPKTLPVEKKGGALIYAHKDGVAMFALVHDVFGYWTISKGGMTDGENEEEATKREIKKEIGLDIEIEEKLGQNEYVASHPEKGKTLKRVVYFLAKSEYRELLLEKSTGLDAARWFPMAAIPELRIYNDIIPLIGKAVEIISNKKSVAP